MKYQEKKRKQEIPWKDGAILKFDFAYLQDVIKAAESMRDTVLTIELIDQSLKGWDGIIGSDDKPLPFDEKNKKGIIDLMMGDVDLMKKVKVAIQGPEGN